VPRAKGTYIEGKVQGAEVNFVLDTGATSTLISKRVYDAIPKESRPILQDVADTTNADGGTLKPYGRADFEIELGQLMLTKQILVADIKDEALLGDDVIRRDKYGPGDVLNSQNVFKLRGADIPLHHVGEPKRVRKVQLASDCEIPPLSESILDVIVESSSEADKCLIIEGGQICEKHSIAVAPTLVDASTSKIVVSRVMNMGMTPITLRKDTTLGYAERVEDVNILLPFEDSADEANFTSVRRISFEPPHVNDGVRSNVQTESGDVPFHLKKLYTETVKSCSAEESKAIASLLNHYESAFSRGEYDLGRTDLVEHEIDTGDSPPIRQRPRRLAHALVGEDAMAIDRQIEQGSVRPSSSPWASPIVLVRKKSGEIRPCVDYRMVNKVTKKDAYPLPHVQDCLDAVAGAVSFSTLDITSAYNQVPVKKEDIPKTAFITRHGLFEYVTMPFGLSNAAATFQRLMELVLRGMQWKLCLIYLDDVIVFGRSFDEHIDRLKDVLERICAARLKLKPDKCHLFQNEVRFLGHVVSKDGVLPNPDNVDKIIKWPVPKTVTDIRAFLGMGNYYRRFIPKYSEVVKDLVKLTKKGEPFVWTGACVEAFETVKSVLVCPDVMSCPLSEGIFILDTDASATHIGAVLSQEQDGVERVIAYGSKTMSRAECNYCTTDRELLAVKYFVLYYKQYLYGRHFRVRSDHQALKWLFTLREPKSRIARWIEELSAFDFEVEYRPGSKHGNADSLSRCTNIRDCRCENNLPLPCGPCSKCQKRSDEMSSQETDVCREVLGTPELDVVDVVDLKTMLYIVELLFLLPLMLTYHAVYGMEICFKNMFLYIVLIMMILWNSMDATKPSLRAKTLYGLIVKILSYSVRVPVQRLSETESDGRTRPKLVETMMGYPMIILGRIPCIHAFVRAVETRSKTPILQGYSDEELRKKQMNDPDIGCVIKWIESGKRPFGPDVVSASPVSRHYWNYWHSLSLKNGLLFRKFSKKDGTGEYFQFIVPRSMKSEVMHQVHAGVLSGHLGRKKTKEKALQKFYWFGIRQDLNLWILKCDICASNKGPLKTPRAPLGDMRVGGVMDRLAIDVLGPFPKTPRGNQYILVVTDHFTNWVEVLPMVNQKAETCAQALVNEVISRLGCPIDLHSDQGSNFRGDIFRELCRLLEVRKTQASVKHPEGNGKVERFNKTLVRMIRSYLHDEQTDWDLYLGCLAGAYRATPHEATGITPNLMMLGRETRMPGEVICGSITTTDGTKLTQYPEYVEHIQNRMQKAHDVARQNLCKKALRQNQMYDGKLPRSPYNRGDYVWYLNESRSVGACPKLQSLYHGPCLVIKKISDLDYLIQLDQSGRLRVVHQNKIKKYEGDVKLKWAASALRRKPQ